MSEERFDRIEQRLEQFDARFDQVNVRLDRLEAGQTELAAGQAELKAGQTELKHEMHVLHEDVIDRIKAVRPDGPSWADMRQAFAQQDERLARRLDPLEAAVRQLFRERQ